MTDSSSLRTARFRDGGFWRVIRFSMAGLPVRSIWRSRNVWGRGPAVLVAVLTLLSCQTPSVVSVTPAPNGKGVITGGIIPCEGIPIPSGPRYAAGTVTVFKGHIASTGVLPTTAVAQESVAVNATYRFVLDPGQYVLQAQFPPPANVLPFASVTLRAGDNLGVDIPNMCM